MESAVALAFVTAPTHDIAEQIVRTLVEEELAACGNIVAGVTSIYRWRDAIQRESEALIVLKTTRTATAKLIARVEELHPYEVPEVVVVPVTAGLEAYLNWVAAGVHD